MLRPWGGCMCRTIVPIGLLYSGTLWLGNSAYLFLSVSFIQMLKVSGAPLLSPTASLNHSALCVMFVRGVVAARGTSHVA